MQKRESRPRVCHKGEQRTHAHPVQRNVVTSHNSNIKKATSWPPIPGSLKQILQSKGKRLIWVQQIKAPQFKRTAPKKATAEKTVTKIKQCILLVKHKANNLGNVHNIRDGRIFGVANIRSNSALFVIRFDTNSSIRYFRIIRRF